MPELPEVETVRRQLNAVLPGKTIANVTVLDQKMIRGSERFSQRLTNRTIIKTDRVAKLLMFPLSSGETLVCHLKMTGQLIFKSADAITGGGHTLSPTDSDLPHKHTRLWLEFTDGSKLFYNDMRKFGYLRVHTPNEMEVIVSGYGPEPAHDKFTVQYLAKVLKNRTISLKGALLDQAKIAGLGNIYVDESCFMAKIKPTRAAGSLSNSEIKKLHKACVHILDEAVAHGGTTFYSFMDSDGNSGNFSDRLQVFARQKQPCYVCGTTIEKTKTAGRGTHFCPTCQV